MGRRTLSIWSAESPPRGGEASLTTRSPLTTRIAESHFFSCTFRPLRLSLERMDRHSSRRKASISEYRSWRSFEIVTYSSKYSSPILILLLYQGSVATYSDGDTNSKSKEKSVLPIVCEYDRYGSARISCVDKVTRYFEFNALTNASVTSSKHPYVPTCVGCWV